MKRMEAPETQAGFALDGGTLTDVLGRRGPDGLDAFPGPLALTAADIRDSGGIPQAISRKCAAVVRESFQGLEIRQFPPETLDRWEYILSHFRPHLDEYLSSLFLRACLPDDMRRLKLGETFLTSRDDDPQAKALWPRAATLGIGATVNGGAVPLLLFDEHETYGAERESSSLVILMKRYLLGKQRPPYPFYQMLNEVNYIDMYGGGHAKNLATYVKYLNALPAARFGGEAYAPTWKTAVVDACLTACYLGLQETNVDFHDRARWEPYVRRSLADYARRASLRDEPEFPDAMRKVTRYLTTMFARAQARGDLKVTVTDRDGKRVVKGRDTGHETELNLLLPYLPYLCFRYWGGMTAQLVLYFLWEGRFQQELLFTRRYEELCAAIPKDCDAAEGLSTPLGLLNIVSSEVRNKSGRALKVYDLTSTGGGVPGPLNRYVKTRDGGFGLTLFRDAEIGTTVLTKGEAVSMDLWEKLCGTLIEREGASDMDAAEGPQGAWHVTRNPSGIAGFLLNGNPTHRYVPRTGVTARSLAKIAEECAAQDASNSASTP